jgi:hypothetical protein
MYLILQWFTILYYKKKGGGNKLKSKVNEKNEYFQCIHHWILEIPNKGKSKGICKKCKEEKFFDSFLPVIPSWNSKKKAKTIPINPLQKQQNNMEIKK